MTNHGFAFGGPTILSHPIFVETILPFLLVFTVVFAILQKSKILGDGKKQIDAIVSLVIGLLVVSFAQATGVIIQLVPFLAVSLIIVLVFLLLLGSFTVGKDDFKLPKGIFTALVVLAIIAVVSAVVYITNVWTYLVDIFFFASGTSFFINAIFVVLIVVAIWVVIKSSSSSSS